jgi:hypothetical protein
LKLKALDRQISSGVQQRALACLICSAAIRRYRQCKWLEINVDISGFERLNGGEGGIRTPDTVARMPHFECGAFDHSATSPRGATAMSPNEA